MNGRNIFTLLIIAFMAAMMVGSFDYAGTAAFDFPFAVSAVTLLMGVILWLREAFFARPSAASAEGAPGTEEATAHTTDEKVDDDVEKNWKEIAIIYGFFASFLVLSYFASYLVAVPVFLFTLTWWYCREKWLPSAVLTVGVSLFVYMLFGTVLHSF